MMRAMQIFHIAEKSRWDAAKLAGSYAQSTYGRSLEDEGFIHASRADQWESVRERHYADAPGQLVLLTIETDKLTSEWREDTVGDTTYPHIYGPLNPAAVVSERLLPRLQRDGTPRPQESFAKLFFAEIITRMSAAVLVMVLAIAGHYAAVGILGEDRWLLGVIAGAVVGLVIVVPLLRRRNDRLKP